VTDSLPKRLKSDAIVEAVTELRFEADESVVPEILLGRLADNQDWAQFRTARLPTADIPGPIRRADPNLRYQPSFEMVSKSGEVAVRIGPQSIVFARRGAYPGWSTFGPEVRRLVEHTYKVMPTVTVSRIGMRYINALRSDLHSVHGLPDVAIKVLLDGVLLDRSLNLNFKSDVGSEFESTSRIATVDLADGQIPEKTSLVLDIDVYTQPDFAATGVESCWKWIDGAHTREREQFFRILGVETTERLRAD
jgi:uncharacterized protein (TIGR04255 family)